MYRVALVLPCLFLLGCTGDEQPVLVETVPVSGTATYQGKPLEDYRINFSNLTSRSATGMIDADGHFVLGTNEVGDGAAIATHTVWLTYSPEIEQEPGNEQVDVRLPPPKVKLPRKFTRAETSGITVEVPPEGLTDYKLELEE